MNSFQGTLASNQPIHRDAGERSTVSPAQMIGAR